MIDHISPSSSIMNTAEAFYILLKEKKTELKILQLAWNVTNPNSSFVRK